MRVHVKLNVKLRAAGVLDRSGTEMEGKKVDKRR